MSFSPLFIWMWTSCPRRFVDAKRAQNNTDFQEPDPTIDPLLTAAPPPSTSPPTAEKDSSYRSAEQQTRPQQLETSIPSHHSTRSPSYSTQNTTAEMALRLLMSAKVAAANCIHELEVIDGMLDDWPTSTHGNGGGDSQGGNDAGPRSPSKDKFKALTNAALDMHLALEYAAQECQGVCDVLDQLTQLCREATKPVPSCPRVVGMPVEAPDTEVMMTELEVRRDNAAEHALKVWEVAERVKNSPGFGVVDGVNEEDLGLVEMEKRIGKARERLRIVEGKLSGLRELGN